MSDKKTLIAVPAMDMCPTAFAYSLAALRRDCPSRISMICGAAVHEARNALAREAIESGCDRVLWLDSDMSFDDDLMIRLGADLDAGWDMVCGIFFKRRLPVTPVIYKDIRAENGRVEIYADYPQGMVFPVAGCGFGAVLMTTELLRSVCEAYGRPFNLMDRLSEDLSFCKRAETLGAKIGCDSRVKVGHVGQLTFGENMYRRT